MSDRTLKIRNYTLKKENYNINIFEENELICSTNIIRYIEDFIKELDTFLKFFSRENIDKIVRWYFNIEIDKYVYYYFEEEDCRDKLRVIQYLKSRELEKYLKDISPSISLNCITTEYCCIKSTDKYLKGYALQKIETITGFYLKEIKTEEYGVDYKFERGDVL